MTLFFGEVAIVCVTIEYGGCEDIFRGRFFCVNGVNVKMCHSVFNISVTCILGNIFL